MDNNYYKNIVKNLYFNILINKDNNFSPTIIENSNNILLIPKVAALTNFDELLEFSSNLLKNEHLLFLEYLSIIEKNKDIIGKEQLQTWIYGYIWNKMNIDKIISNIIPGITIKNKKIINSIIIDKLFRVDINKYVDDSNKNYHQNSCNTCMQENEFLFKGSRFRCKICNDYDQCYICNLLGFTNDYHTNYHIMEKIEL